jgi:hypothetical protein
MKKTKIDPPMYADEYRRAVDALHLDDVSQCAAFFGVGRSTAYRWWNNGGPPAAIAMWLRYMTRLKIAPSDVQPAFSQKPKKTLPRLNTHGIETKRGVGRPRRWNRDKKMQARFEADTMAQMERSLEDGESKVAFVDAAVRHEIARRTGAGDKADGYDSSCA